MNRDFLPSGQSGGFTLLELLMAMAVFSVMSAMAYGGLASILTMRQTLERQADDLGALQMTFNRLETDLEQAVVRLHRNESTLTNPAFSGGEGLDFLLEFTRGGWSNPRQIARSGLQRVAYRWKDRSLERYYWSTLDGMSQETPQSSRLLEHVGAVEIRFLDSNQTWHSFWPPNLGAGLSASGLAQTPLPRAVEIIIEKQGWGRMRRLFEVVSP